MPEANGCHTRRVSASACMGRSAAAPGPRCRAARACSSARSASTAAASARPDAEWEHGVGAPGGQVGHQRPTSFKPSSTSTKAPSAKPS
ncbi:hypothetical protein [Actinokineospora globicatena]|uniref:hypothetical protein n=1 Tax=Actinokineospora globicatena TaxID=103729 RepID=UPI0025562BDA|nr:hypothetical protein [Actinokineospora globicatena]